MNVQRTGGRGLTATPLSVVLFNFDGSMLSAAFNSWILNSNQKQNILPVLFRFAFGSFRSMMHPGIASFHSPSAERKISRQSCLVFISVKYKNGFV